MKTIDSARGLEGKRVIIRADYNVPVADGVVVDPARIDASLETVRHVISHGGIPVIMSHIESEEGTLQPVYDYLSRHLDISFVKDYFPHKISLPAGPVLLENLRQYPGEKENDQDFARHLSELGDIYVNEAFPACHRKHASIVGIPRYLPSFAGFRLAEEITALRAALNPKPPLLFILGGAKFETKIPLLERYLPLSETVIVAGAIANDFLAAQGLPIGRSLTSSPEKAAQIPTGSLALPVDVIVVRGNDSLVLDVADVKDDDVIVDVGPRTIGSYQSKVQNAATIIWNGPLGAYEKGFDQSTKALADMVSASAAEAYVGGGDTAAALRSLQAGSRVFISTGGGAMLDFLASGTLPGIDALIASQVLPD
jgi:phosphoglycerate kinase